MDQTELLEEQAVLCHGVFDTRLEQDAGRQRTEDDDDGHDRNDDTGDIADDRKLRSHQSDRRIGSRDLIDRQQTGSDESQAAVECQDDDRRQDQTSRHVLVRISDLTGHVAGSAHAVI